MACERCEDVTLDLDTGHWICEVCEEDHGGATNEQMLSELIDDVVTLYGENCRMIWNHDHLIIRTRKEKYFKLIITRGPIK